MIEVLFGESEAASMKVAKNKIVIGTTNGPTSVWIAGKKTPLQKPFTGWIEGTPEEVICLGFMMDIGNIKAGVKSRQKNLQDFYRMRNRFQKKKFICMPCYGVIW